MEDVLGAAVGEPEGPWSRMSLGVHARPASEHASASGAPHGDQSSAIAFVRSNDAGEQ